jgi:hypothetical protein
MAIRFDELKHSILIVLYDYMLTSDHETFWFSVPSIQDGLPPAASGALTQRAIDSLISDSELEVGSSDGVSKDVYALTELGIASAEAVIEQRGVSIEDYEPAPSADVILSRFSDPAIHSELNSQIGELKRELETSNSVAAVLGDDRDLITEEVDVAVQFAAKDRLRVARLQALILPTLRFLAEKFAGQAIGELAKRLVQFLIGLN